MKEETCTKTVAGSKGEMAVDICKMIGKCDNDDCCSCSSK